jgi:hypothetical protein
VLSGTPPAHVYIQRIKNQGKPLFSTLSMLIAGTVALAVSWLTGYLGYSEADEAPWAYGLAVIASIGAQKKLLNGVHPPAASYSYFFIMEKLDVMGILFPGAAGAAAVGLVQFIWKKGIMSMGWEKNSKIAALNPKESKELA